MDTNKTDIPHYIIGTRGSLLALTQCLQMKDLMEKDGKATFSLKIIKTEGDENTQAPLWALDGKDFFTKELDQALLSGQVDLVVHSYKDLGSERPQGITLAAITQRKFAHDILFVRKEIVKKLQNKEVKKFVVGTSSPRRMENLKAHLHKYLPYGEENNVEVETKNLRGNVNTRLQKCVDGDYDGVVLALPGIERLALGLKDDNNEAYERHGNPQVILKELIKKLNYMVLPLGEFPAAASQGALAIECLEKRSDNGELLSFLSRFNDEQTIAEVSQERKLFQTFGGGCHLAVGINVSTSAGGLRKSLAGAVDNKKIKELSLLRKEPLPAISGEAFIGLPKVESFSKAIPDKLTIKESSKIKALTLEDHDVLITSPSVVDFLTDGLYEDPKELSKIFWWASGTKTMKKMAGIGLWVSGCADSLGEEHLKNLRESALIKLFNRNSSWLSLTHGEADTLLGRTHYIYHKTYKDYEPSYKEKVESCGLYYWTSFTQYQYFSQTFNLNPKAIHACGLGKTFQGLKEVGRNPLPVCSMAELQDWIN